MVDVACAVDITQHAVLIAQGQSPYHAIVVLSEDIDLTPAYEFAVNTKEALQNIAKHAAATTPASSRRDGEGAGRESARLHRSVISGHSRRRFPPMKDGAQMKSAELMRGRTFGVTFDHGEGFFDALTTFCASNEVKQGYIPMFIAGFSEVELVGTCEKLDDPRAPVWSRVYLENVEALGCGTIAFDPEQDKILPHIHAAVGLKPHSAAGHTSHLLSAKVQFLTEMLVIEVIDPDMRRIVNPEVYDVPLLTFVPRQQSGSLCM